MVRSETGLLWLLIFQKRIWRKKHLSSPRYWNLPKGRLSLRSSLFQVSWLILWSRTRGDIATLLMLEGLMGRSLPICFLRRRAGVIDERGCLFIEIKFL